MTKRIPLGQVYHHCEGLQKIPPPPKRLRINEKMSDKLQNGTIMEYNWTTEFDTSKEQMIHAFENNVKVIVDFKLRHIIVCYNGDKINSFMLDEIGFDEYKDFLINTSKQAKACALI